MCLLDARIGLVESMYLTMRSFFCARTLEAGGEGDHFCGPRNLCGLGVCCVYFGLGGLVLGVLGGCG
jgi:hypothetical protein